MEKKKEPKKYHTFPTIRMSETLMSAVNTFVLMHHLSKAEFARQAIIRYILRDGAE